MRQDTKQPLSYHRRQFAQFLEDEDRGAETILPASKRKKGVMNGVTIGNLKYKTREGPKEIDIDLHLKSTHPSACAFVTTRKEYFISLTSDWLDTPELHAVIAHELGHIICGHLDVPQDWTLDRNRRKAAKYLKLSGKDDVTGELYKKYWLCYMRATYFGLMRGGVLTRELEADIAGSKFVGSEAMSNAHRRNLEIAMSSHRSGVIFELLNRIVRLQSMDIKPRLKFDLDLYL